MVLLELNPSWREEVETHTNNSTGFMFPLLVTVNGHQGFFSSEV